MTKKNPDPIAVARANLGVATRWRDDEAVVVARAALAAANLEKTINRAVDEALISDDERVRLAALLRDGVK